MCGRYLIEEEAYCDILETLYRADNLSGFASMVAGEGSKAIAPVMKEAIAATLTDPVSETVPEAMRDLFCGASPLVVNGEVFPTNYAPVLTQGGVRASQWGFHHPKISSVIINARAETALEKRMFRDSLLERRCVVLSNGFFEWGSANAVETYQHIQIGMFGSGDNMLGKSGHKRGKKTKYLLRHPEESKLYMAGFWDTFKDNAGEHNAFVILTTSANDSISPIHNRMPVILSPDEKDDWLDSASFMEYVLRRPGPELAINAGVGLLGL